MSHHRIFDPATLLGLALQSRIVMSPMTRSFSPGGVPGADVAEYYRRRAAGGVGLIITEGTWIPHSSASNDPNVPCFHGADALAGWANVVREVHAAGGLIFPQLWHCGLIENAILGMRSGEPTPLIEPHQVSPSGFAGGMGKAPLKMGEPMTLRQIEEIVEAFGAAAADAVAAGFDGIELHGAHGYLIDQFLWDRTNARIDHYGGGIADRTRFAVEAVRECRRRTHPEFPISMRVSQWKSHDFEARLATTPDELGELLRPLVDAGVDLFHCSTRHYTTPEFDGSDMNLAGWVKKLSGKPTITVGSVGLGPAFEVESLERLEAMFDRGDFDLVAVGRSLLADPQWVRKMRDGRPEEIRTFDRSQLATLA